MTTKLVNISLLALLAWLAPVARWFKAARRRHLVHHFDDHARGYGVSTGLWDHVFGTVAEK